MPKTKGKLLITLNDVSASKIILSQYTKKGKGIVEFEDEDGDIPLTMIDLGGRNETGDVADGPCYFLDVWKIENKLWPNMIDLTTHKPLPRNTTKMCWWDRHQFNYIPLGCPLMKTKNEDSYDTEGYFCSFSCCKAYIIDKRSDQKYKNSLALLTNIYLSCSNKLEPIPIAPSWKILKAYGGHLTIDEYRDSFGKVEYIETVNSKRIKSFSIPQYIQEKKLK